MKEGLFPLTVLEADSPRPSGPAGLASGDVFLLVEFQDGRGHHAARRSMCRSTVTPYRATRRPPGGATSIT